MKYFKIVLYLLLPIIFIYIILNINSSIYSLSIVMMNFFKSLFPYLFTFLIINNLLIKTNLISFFGYILQLFLYPFFKINAKGCNLLLISLLNGFPSSALYSSIMVKENKINKKESQKIASLFFLPSTIFIFYLIKDTLSSFYFIIFIISLYLPCFILLFIKKDKNEYIPFKDIKENIKLAFNNFDYIADLKSIFFHSITNLINIFGMICFYSIITLIIPNIFLKGLFEFSMPSIEILNSNYSDLLKSFSLLIILVFSSFSSISQASIYLEDIDLKVFSFIKTRIVLLSLSLLIFTLLLYFFLL